MPDIIVSTASHFKHSHFDVAHVCCCSLIANLAWCWSHQLATRLAKRNRRVPLQAFDQVTTGCS
jgi:hypothetical protein